MVDEVQKDGNLDLEDSELIKNAIEFSDNIAEKIITHRVDLEGVDITATKEEIIDINLSDLRANPYQPRKVFNDEALNAGLNVLGV